MKSEGTPIRRTQHIRKKIFSLEQMHVTDIG